MKTEDEGHFLEGRLRVEALCRVETQHRPRIGRDISGSEIQGKRTHVISFLEMDKTKKDKAKAWIDLFEVKSSTIPNSGNGLFTLRDIKAEEIIGLFCGAIKNKRCNIKHSNYTMKSYKWDVMFDACGGITSNNPVYFGIQFANDPLVTNDDGKATTHGSMIYHNIFVDDYFIARASVDITAGSELFLNYKWNPDVKCNCNGCKSVEIRFPYDPSSD